MQTIFNNMKVGINSDVQISLTKKARKLKNKLAKQKLERTALKLVYSKKNELDFYGVETISNLIDLLSNDVKPFGINIDVTGGLSNIMISALKVTSLYSMRYSELPYIQKMFNNDKLLIESYIEYSHNYSFVEFIEKILPLSALVFYIIAMFELKIVALEECNNEHSLDKKCLRLLAYFHKIGLVELSANENVVGSEMIVQKLKSGISGYTTKESIKEQSANSNKTDRNNVNIFNNLISNAYKVKYVSGKNGKHAFHKSPEPHWRKEHWKTARNGFKVHIRGTWVNRNSDSTLLAA